MRSWRRAASERKSLPPFLRSTGTFVVQESLPPIVSRPDIHNPKAPKMRLLPSRLVLCFSLVCLSHKPRYHGDHSATLSRRSFGNKGSLRSVPRDWCVFSKQHARQQKVKQRSAQRSERTPWTFFACVFVSKPLPFAVFVLRRLEHKNLQKFCQHAPRNSRSLSLCPCNSAL